MIHALKPMFQIDRELEIIENRLTPGACRATRAKLLSTSINPPSGER
jgi:hypothetical protein